MAALIDPEELPFTSDEIYEAAKTFLPATTAREMADHLAEVGPGLIEARRERRLGWERGGVATLPSCHSMVGLIRTSCCRRSLGFHLT